MTTSIEWAQNPDGTEGETWNPTRGCVKISPGCKFCYAKTFAERWRGIAGHPYEQGFDPRLVPDALEKPLHWKKPRGVFVNSMSDLFLEEFPNEYIAAVFGVMAAAPQHRFLVLTKRAKRMREWFEWATKRGEQGARVFPDDPLDWRIRQMCHVEARRAGVDMNPDERQNHGGPWPLPNVWLGVSVESQEYADERIPHLLATPAAVRFLSCEPLLGPVDLSAWFPSRSYVGSRGGQDDFDSPIDWVIVGGESGAGKKTRPMQLEWARSILRQCRGAGVPAFFKQAGERPRVGFYDEIRDEWEQLTGAEWPAPIGWSETEGQPRADALVQLRLKKKGGDLALLPAEFRVREMPEASRG